MSFESIRYRIEESYFDDSDILIYDEKERENILRLDHRYKRYAQAICAELNKIDALEKLWNSSIRDS